MLESRKAQLLFACPGEEPNQINQELFLLMGLVLLVLTFGCFRARAFNPRP